MAQLFTPQTGAMMAGIMGNMGAQPGTFAGNLAGGLQGANAAYQQNQQNADNGRTRLLQQQELQMELLKYQAETAQYAKEYQAYLEEEARKKGDIQELRDKMPEHLRDLYDVDRKRALDQHFTAPMTESERLNYGLNVNDDRRQQSAEERAGRTEERDIINDEYQSTLDASRERREIEAHERDMSKPPEGDEYELAYQRIIDANPQLGQSEEGQRHAKNLAMDLIRSSTSPVTGETTTYNLATNQGQPVQLPRVQQQPLGTPGKPSQPMPTMQQMAGEVGLPSAIADLWGRTYGQVNPEVVDEAKRAAAVELGAIKNDLRSGLVIGVGAVWEQKQISELMPDEGIWESPARALASLRQLKAMVERSHNTNLQIMEGPSVSPQLYRQLEQKNAILGSVHKRLNDTGEAISPFAEEDPGNTAAADAPQAEAAAAPASDPQTQTRMPLPRPGQDVPVKAQQQQAEAMGLDWQSVEDTANKYQMTTREVLDVMIQQGGGGG